jgi:hypothetical protein
LGLLTIILMVFIPCGTYLSERRRVRGLQFRGWTCWPFHSRRPQQSKSFSIWNDHGIVKSICQAFNTCGLEPKPLAHHLRSLCANSSRWLTCLLDESIELVGGFVESTSVLMEYMPPYDHSREGERLWEEELERRNFFRWRAVSEEV